MSQTTTTTDAAQIAADKFCVLLGDAAASFAAMPVDTEGYPRGAYVTPGELFVLSPSRRIRGKEVAGLVWQDLSGPYRPGAESVLPIEDGLVMLCRTAVGMYQPHDGEFHKLLYVVWSDGSRSWASFSWSLFGGESEPGYLYVGNGQGSTYLTVRFEKETMRHPIR